MKKILPLLCSLLLCSCHLSIDIDATYKYDDEDFEKGNTTLEVSDLDSLNIDWIAGNVTIKYYDEDFITIEEDDEEDLLSSQMLRYYYNEKDNELQIRFCKSGIDHKKIRDLKKNLTIYFPQDSVIKYFNSNFVSTNLKVEDVICKKYDNNSVSSDVFISIKDITSNIRINTVSGDTTITGDSLENFDFVSTKGDFTIATKIAPKEGNTVTTSGDSFFYFPDDISGFNIDLYSVSGDFSFSSKDFAIDYDDDVCSFGDKSSKYEVHSTSGDVYIKKLSDFSN